MGCAPSDPADMPPVGWWKPLPDEPVRTEPDLCWSFHLHVSLSCAGISTACLLVRSFPGPTPASSMGSRWSPSADGGAPGGGSQARLLLQTACATRWPSRPPFASKRPEDKIAPKMTRRAPRSPPRAWAGSAPPARLIVNCGGFRPPCGRSGPAPTSNRTPGPTRGVGHDQTPLHSSALSLHPGRTSDRLLRRCAAEWGGGWMLHLGAWLGVEMSHLRRCAAPRAVVLRRAEVRIKGRLPRLHSAPWFELICRRPGRI